MARDRIYNKTIEGLPADNDEFCLQQKFRFAVKIKSEEKERNNLFFLIELTRH